MKWRLTGFAAIAAMMMGLIWAAQSQWHQANGAARDEFIREARAQTRNDIKPLERAIASIYENLRTLSYLPPIQQLNRHGENLSSEARIIVQQVYNNLASSVAVSEVYFTPIDFDPKKIDPVTGKTEEPSLMFDELILNAGLAISRNERAAAPEAVRSAANTGPPEVEEFEYDQLVDHATWLAANFPAANGKGLDVPFISGPEVITCDNTHFITSGNNADRSGIIFTVPVFAIDGRIKGMVSAIILTSSLRELVTGDNYALVNPGNSFTVFRKGFAFSNSTLQHVARGEPDETLVYSETIPFSVNDARNPWTVWAGAPPGAFEASKSVFAAYAARRTSFIMICGTALAGLLGLLFASRVVSQNKRIAAMALASEEEARQNAQSLEQLNTDINRLNSELADRLKELHEAQEDIIRKGKLAQLGQVIATVAHEIRNPLGGIRTSAFLLRRKLEGGEASLLNNIGRIEKGILRCDSIITQLLDYSRTKKLIVEPRELDGWLEQILPEEVETLPAAVHINCDLGANGTHIAFDPERLRRAITNLLQNAVEAMMDKDKALTNFTGDYPVIHISTRPTSNGIELTVRDNGPGMEPDVLSRIREPLFTTKSFGTGLGIPAIEKIVDLHGGTFAVQSEPGKGTVVRLLLPRAGATIQSAA